MAKDGHKVTWETADEEELDMKGKSNSLLHYFPGESVSATLVDPIFESIDLTPAMF